MSVDALRIITILTFTNLVAKSMASMVPEIVSLPSIEGRDAMIPIAPFTPATQVKLLTQPVLSKNVKVWGGDVNVQHPVNTLSLLIAYNGSKSVRQSGRIGKPRCC